MESKPFIVGIAGGTGSGKTTVAQAIMNSLNHENVLNIQHDFYYINRDYMAPLKREKINYDHPEALETELLVKHLNDLIAGKRVEIPAYDFTTHTRKKKGINISPTKVIIVDGNLIFTEQNLRKLMDIKIFVDTDDDIRFIRRLNRDIKERGRSMKSVIQQYMETVKPMHIEFVEPSKKYADIILTDGHNPVAIETIVSIIKDKVFA